MISPRDALRVSLIASVSLTAGAACSGTFSAAEDANAGAAGTGGSAGNTNSAGSGGSGNAAGSSGSSGSGGSAGGAGAGGDAGAGGTAGSAGSGGASGDAGSGGTAGSAGTGGSGGTAGSAGTGGSGGDAGSAGSCSHQMCGNTCIDITSDSAHCGACNYACVAGRSCNSGACSSRWITLSASGAPAARVRHGAVWDGSTFHTTGGGVGGITMGAKTGGRYDPQNDTWAGAPELTSERCGHAMVHGPEGSFIYGGIKDCADGTTTVGALDQLVGASWGGVNENNAPVARYSLSAVWAHGELFTYGGSSETVAYTSTAAAYDPDAERWNDLNCTAAYCPRAGRFSAFVDGDVIRVWGGAGPGGSELEYGMVYDPNGGSWAKWEPLPEGTPSIIDQIADAGDYVYALIPDGSGTDPDNACGGDIRIIVYDKAAGIWRRGPTAPAGTSAAAAVAWTGTEFIAWSGQCGTGASSVGARYQPPADPSTLPALVP